MQKNLILAHHHTSVELSVMIMKENHSIGFCEINFTFNFQFANFLLLGHESTD